VSSGDRFADERLTASAWDAGPGATFAVHEHSRAKLLVCRSGSIRFTLTRIGQEIDLAPGDWLDLPAAEPHSAVVGPTGCRCEEAFR
jgi:quercetin dioxygenase-like cupin family protein